MTQQSKQASPSLGTHQHWAFVSSETPLEPALRDWQTAVLDAPGTLEEWVEEHGSPLHLQHPATLVENARWLESVARARGVDLGVFFARKANKCLSYVHSARDAGLGVDTASEQEVVQSLDAGVSPDRIVCTAAVKPRGLLDACASHAVKVVLDGPCEARQFAARVAALGCPPRKVALRVSGFEVDGDKLHSRFGVDIDDAMACVSSLWSDPDVAAHLRLEGLHFHLDGYSLEHRVRGIRECLPLAAALRGEGHDIRSLDIGGGLPVRYLRHAAQWWGFWERLKAAQLGEQPPITHRNDGLGWTVEHDEGEPPRLCGTPRVYPFWQPHNATEWLGRLLDTKVDGERTVARALGDAGLDLECEPGRALLDGCGLTVARVASVKRHRGGHDYIALEMNRTQCRTSSRDLLLDPIHLPRSERALTGATEGRSRADRRDIAHDGYLVGAYCIENELLLWRRLRFKRGIAPGDLVVFPNTAGYFMHFLESRSHQFPMARNLEVQIGPSAPDPAALTARLDPIDQPPVP